MSSTTSDAVAANKAAGESAESSVQEHVPQLGLVPDDVVEHYDAVATDVIVPTSALPMVGICLLERGTVTEIKSTIRRYADQQRGRFYIRRRQHEQLLEDGGVYLFAVCGDSRQRTVLALKAVPATIVDDLVNTWLDGGPGRMDYAQVSWGRVFDSAEVDDV